MRTVQEVAFRGFDGWMRAEDGGVFTKMRDSSGGGTDLCGGEGSEMVLI